MPDAVRGAHVDGGIEFPSWPCCLARRIGGSMKQHMVDTCQEQLVEFGFYLRQRRAEMLRQPRHRFARHQRFASDVCGTRRILQRGFRAQRFHIETSIIAQSSDAKAIHVKVLYLRYVSLGIEVYQVAGRAMCLIAGSCPMAVCPTGPLLGEVLKEHIGECLSVVGHHLCLGQCGRSAIADTKQDIQVFCQ